MRELPDLRAIARTYSTGTPPSWGRVGVGEASEDSLRWGCRFPLPSPPPAWGRGFRIYLISYAEAWTQPQHFARPSSTLSEGTPSTGLAVMSSTPVLKKSRPGVFSGFFLVLT